MPTTAEPTAPKDVDADSTPQELDDAGIYELEVGSDETTWGRVYADDAGQFNFSGDRADLVEDMVRFYAKMYSEHLSEFGADEAEFTPNAVLAFMDARMNGRTWARVPGSVEGAEPEPEGEPAAEETTENDEPNGEVAVKESFTPAPDPEWEEATFNEAPNQPRDDAGRWASILRETSLWETKEAGVHFKTGQEVTFPTLRNTASAPKRMKGVPDQFQQDIEPAGRYLLHDSAGSGAAGKVSPGWQSGTLTFKNPLVMKLNSGTTGGTYDADSWKSNLSKMFGGKTGKALSRAVAKAGHDGIVTVDKYGTSEIVDLTYLHGLTSNEVRHAPAGSPKGGQFVAQGGGGTGGKAKGHKEKTKIQGHDVTLEHQGDGTAKVVEGPESLKGKTLRPKAPPVTKPAEPGPKADPKPAPKAAPARPKAEIKTPEDAEAHFEKEHKTRLKNGGLPEAEFVAQSRAVDAEMTRLKEFKAVADTIKKRPSSGRELELGTDFASETGSAAGAASAYKFGTGVRLGKDSAFDPKAAPRFGGHTVGEDAGSQFRHEFGHEVYNEGFSGAKRTSWEKAAGKYVGTATVSRYGGTNPSELFSESFSAYTSPNYRPGSLPKEIEGWLDENVRGKKRAPTANAATHAHWETLDDGRLVLNGRVIGD